jgi:putative endonuclease
MDHYIYILQSKKSAKFYIGYSIDPWKRLEEHNSQNFFSTYTSKHRPWTLKAIFHCGDSKAQAMKIEKYIKKQKSRKLIEQLIDADFRPSGELAQLVRVPYIRD